MYCRDESDNEEVAMVVDNSNPDLSVNVKKKPETENIRRKNSKYYCEKCGKNVSSLRSLRRHTQTFHANEDYALINRTDLKPETKTDDASSENEISCRECNKSFPSHDDYLKHKIIHKKTFECDVCQKVFRIRFRFIKAL